LRHIGLSLVLHIGVANGKFGLRQTDQIISLGICALASAFFLLSAGLAKAQTPVAEIPYRYDYSGWITVPVTVNGQGPYDFIVDTGATLSVVFENLAEQQEFPFVDGDLKRILGLIEANSLPPRQIGRIEAGGLALENLESVVINDWLAPRVTPQGVLGLDFLSRYVVEIDPEDSVIRLYDRAVPDVVKDRKWGEARLTPVIFAASARPLYTVKARIRRKLYPFILDLGASGTLINYPALEDMLVTRRVNIRSTPTGFRDPKVQDLFGNEQSARLVRIQRIKVGRAVWRNTIVNVYNSDVFKELSVGEEPYGLLGADLLQGRGVVIDFPGNRIHIGPEVEPR
jgi:hypothetical protein